jgi:hypothetical protein
MTNNPVDGDDGNTGGAVATPFCVVTVHELYLEVLLCPRLALRTEYFFRSCVLSSIPLRHEAT